MRRRVLASLGGGWKNPYVTEGLIAMWDGIERTGSTADSWVDLVSGKKLSIDASAAFTSNSLSARNFQGKMFVSDGFDELPFRTIEVVIRSSILDAKKYIVFALAPRVETVLYRLFALTSYYTNGNPLCLNAGNGRLYYNLGNPADSADKTNSYSIVYNGTSRTANASAAYKNASLLTGTGAQSHGADGFSLNCANGNMDVDVFCIRFYSSALTAAQIAANNAVDVERFNLPDAA